MGRIFETRKSTMFARWDKMAKQFARIGKEITIAVKQGGANPDNNPILRRCIQNAKGVNMPKDKVDAAIKRASEKNISDFQTVIYEGYGPNGVAIIVETATDNPTRTVANVRMHFNRSNGSLGTSGSVSFSFTSKGEFKIREDKNLNFEHLELELIDFGLEEIGTDNEGNIIIFTDYTNFGKMSDALQEMGITPLSSELTRIPNTYVSLEPKEEEEALQLVDKLEQDEDVQKVYHNLK